MNRKLVCVLFVFVAGVAGGGPAADGAPSSYAWCKHLREDSHQDNAKEALDPDTDPGRAVPALLQALCYPRENARGKRGALEAMRRTWMQRLALDEQDWATDIVGWGNLSYGDRMALLGRTVDPRFDTAWSEAGPIEQWTQIRTKVGPSAAFSLQPGAPYYLADAFPPTEAGRLGFIERCMFASGVDDEPHPVEWAVCQPDLDALDAGKLAAELRRETARPLADRVALRLALHKVQHHLPRHAAKVKQLVAK